MEKYVEKFSELEKTLELMEGEIIVHCLDDKSFGGKFYFPKWAVTNKARVYSLYKNDWLKSHRKKSGKKLKNGIYSTQRDCIDHTNVHQLVANYFCDKTPIDLYGEKNVEVHHRYSFNPNKSCEENNCAENLRYEYKPDHKEITSMQNGSYVIPEETDFLIRILMNTIAYHKKGMVDITYNDLGEKEMNLSVQLNQEEGDKNSDK